MPKVPLRLIAERVGCTRSTVSYALRDHPTISAELTRKIKTVARRMGWIPDAELQQQMALVRTSNLRKNLPNLAIVINRARVEFDRWNVLGAHLNGVVKRAHELGFATDLFSLSEQPLSENRLEGILVARGVKGVVLVDVDVTHNDELLQVAERFATVSVGVIPQKQVVHTVTADYLAIGRRIIAEIAQLGYRRPGIVIPRGTEELVQWSFTGGLQAGLAMNRQVQRLPIFHTETEVVRLPNEEIPRLQNWMFESRPDCCITLDSVTLSAFARLYDLPIRKSIFSLDYQEGDGAVGGIDQNPFVTGASAVELLATLIRPSRAPEPKVLRSMGVKATWVPPVSEIRYSEACEVRLEELQK